MIAALVGVVWGDLRLSDEVTSAWSRGSLIPLAIGALAIAGSFELLKMARAAGYEPMSIVVVLGVGACHGQLILQPHIHRWTRHDGLVAMLGLIFVAVAIAQVHRRRTERGIGDIAVSLAIALYMGLLPAFLTLTRMAIPGETGVWAVLGIVAIVKCTDIGAYFTGMAIGKTKLIPQISPAKTIEGLVGGLTLAAIVAVLFDRMVDLGPEGKLGILKAAITGIVLGGIGQIGDLTESVFKRDADVKDSANLIPAFGGIMDVLDSPALAAPIAYVGLRAWLG